jgi:hypothetical protein
MSQRELNEKYILRQEKDYIEDIFESTMAIAEEKEKNKKDYLYDTGLRDEFNRPIISYVPTVKIIDSLPTLASNGSKNEMEGGTYANRIAKDVTQFYRRLTPIIKPYNIIIIAINHINQKIEINSFSKTQPQLLYMKVDESIPCGNSAIYYANNLIKFVAVGSNKYNTEDDGFDGFLIRAELLKSRTNKSGQYCNLVYNQVTGFDSILTQYQFALDNELIDGRNPYKYIIGNKDIKFDSRNFRKEFLTNEKLRYALFNNTIPLLEKQLSRVENDSDNNVSDYDLTIRLLKSQELDFAA